VRDVLRRKNKEKLEAIMFILFLVIWVLAGVGILLTFPSV
jgi:flagellar basal body-associated protein FliL